MTIGICLIFRTDNLASVISFLSAVRTLVDALALINDVVNGVAVANSNTSTLSLQPTSGTTVQTIKLGRILATIPIADLTFRTDNLACAANFFRAVRALVDALTLIREAVNGEAVAHTNTPTLSLQLTIETTVQTI
ncbi:MAG: hypothetical protein AAF967_09045 [Pseudomonadota bacterium]